MREGVCVRIFTFEDAHLGGQFSDVFVLSHQLPISFRLDICGSPTCLGRFRLGDGELRSERVAFPGHFRVHLHQLVDLLAGLTQLQGQFLDFIFIDAQGVPAGFERRRAAEPVACVIDFVRGHVRAFQILFLYTVIEARSLDEDKATSCSAVQSVHPKPQR